MGRKVKKREGFFSWVFGNLFGRREDRGKRTVIGNYDDSDRISGAPWRKSLYTKEGKEEKKKPVKYWGFMPQEFVYQVDIECKKEGNEPKIKYLLEKCLEHAQKNEREAKRTHSPEYFYAAGLAYNAAAACTRTLGNERELRELIDTANRIGKLGIKYAHSKGFTPELFEKEVIYPDEMMRQKIEEASKIRKDRIKNNQEAFYGKYQRVMKRFSSAKERGGSEEELKRVLLDLVVIAEKEGRHAKEKKDFGGYDNAAFAYQYAAECAKKFGDIKRYTELMNEADKLLKTASVYTDDIGTYNVNYFQDRIETPKVHGRRKNSHRSLESRVPVIVLIILFIFSGVLFSSNFTGLSISNLSTKNSNYIGVVLLIIGIIGLYYLRIRNK